HWVSVSSMTKRTSRMKDWQRPMETSVEVRSLDGSVAGEERPQLSQVLPAEPHWHPAHARRRRFIAVTPLAEDQGLALKGHDDEARPAGVLRRQVDGRRTPGKLAAGVEKPIHQAPPASLAIATLIASRKKWVNAID